MIKVSDIQQITQVAPNQTGYFDGRPCFAPDNNTVLFERSGNGISKQRAQLWTVSLDDPATEAVYYKSDDYACYRPAWSWDPSQSSNQIAFTANYCAPGYQPGVYLLTTGGADNSATFLDVSGYTTATLSYPAWYNDGETLLITDYSTYQLITANTNGQFNKVLTPGSMWTGMGTVSQADQSLIAYAGQPSVPCVDPHECYDQSKNRIWIQQGIEGVPELFSSDLPKHIGRAPWFTPDGEWMGYESVGTNKVYQVFVKRVQKPYDKAACVQVSAQDNQYTCQHIKFSPDGSTAVWGQNLPAGGAAIYKASLSW